MIFDSMENAQKYEAVIPGLTAVIAAAMDINAGTFSTGRLSIDGDNLYVNRMTYETHPVAGALAEAHRRYADVMIVNSGKETVLVGELSALEVTKEYDPDIEAMLGRMEESLAARVVLTPKTFLVLFPNEVHAPGCDADGKSTVQKIVGKIKLA